MQPPRRALQRLLAALFLAAPLCGAGLLRPPAAAADSPHEARKERAKERKHDDEKGSKGKKWGHEKRQRAQERWRELEPEQRQRWREQWRKRSPEERERLHRNAERFRRLPPERREQLRRAWEEMRELPPEERRRLLDDPASEP